MMIIIIFFWMGPVTGCPLPLWALRGAPRATHPFFMKIDIMEFVMLPKNARNERAKCIKSI